MNLLFRNKGALALLMVNIFLAMAAYGLVVPVMPTLMRNLGLTGASVGYLTAAYAVTQLLFSPWGGRLGDTIGRKKIIVVGLAMLAVSEAIFGFSSSVYMLFLSRLLGGVGVAFIFPGVMAFTADITTENERAKGIGYISAAMSTGFIIGPGLGGFLAEYGVRVPFYVAAAVVGFVALLSLIVLPESMKKADLIENRLPLEREGLIRQIWQSRKASYFVTLVVLLVLGFGLSNFETVFGLYLDAKHQFGPNDIAFVLTIGAIVGVVIQIGLLDLLVKRLGEMKVMYLSLALGGASIFVILFVHSYWAITIVTIFIFASFDLIRPAASSLLSKSAGERQGYVAGLNSTFTSLGTIIGSVAAGILYDVSLSLPYIAAGATFLICLVGLKLRQRIKQSA
ncbi:MFS transporter [Paenibacillus illinoisensis]|uniref:Multidrug-efflux transporter n=1 Tax=Paenibacillus illinoisensis TaxID=59845 RepID=A0A2W0C7E2_9BACL|nr:MFS transporter [Paenibacillus illinoisensis]PYY27924.1 Multidrug-efflux transporter [Paenibacillus illinoisensis]